MDYDALLVLSFGGPESPDEVRPFLEYVTRGRNVPSERLDEVEEHYQRLGGVSPINTVNRALVVAIEAELETREVRLPVYFGNRNWHPFVEDTLARMSADGARRALVFATSAYGGYSACRQYDEDIARARATVGARAPELVKLRQFFDHPAFVGIFADSLAAALAELDDPSSRVVFTAHSVPLAADVAAGPPGQGGHRYSRQVAEAARLVAEQVGLEDYDLAWQSRSGPPHVPWLEPDIVVALRRLNSRGVPAVAVCPVGFVSDHVEVVWDLDHEARELADRLGMGFARAKTPGPGRRFAALVADLVAEQRAGACARKLSGFPAAGATSNGAPCTPGCCEPVRARA
jgi:ferrochelatase